MEEAPSEERCTALPQRYPATRPSAMYAELRRTEETMRGTDVNGPTAAIRSVAKLHNELLSCGSLYNMKFSPAELS